jgi:large subunit ribosomal protein L13
MIINAENMILGRLGTFAAKQALLGEKVDIVNCDKAVISGRKRNTFEAYKQKRDRVTTTKGPYTSRRADMLVRRTIRGMLPWKQPKGKTAFRRVMCYIGVPAEFHGKETVKIEGADVSKLPNDRYVTIEEICKFMGGR